MSARLNLVFCFHCFLKPADTRRHTRLNMAAQVTLQPEVMDRVQLHRLVTALDQPVSLRRLVLGLLREVRTEPIEVLQMHIRQVEATHPKAMAITRQSYLQPAAGMEDLDIALEVLQTAAMAHPAAEEIHTAVALAEDMDLEAEDLAMVVQVAVTNPEIGTLATDHHLMVVEAVEGTLIARLDFGEFLSLPFPLLP